ncbi:MAG: glycosyltransferase family 4 protein [Microbacteriaceae bacterium]|nr:glycosyltransferase family 4 protein [Microbacteriaceae bacterium]
MTGLACVFVIPGDINTPTGGYIYDRKLIDQLRKQNLDVELISLQGSFPNPTENDQRLAVEAFSNLLAYTPVIIDGLAFGAMEKEVVSSISAPIIALVHHPLAHEGGLDEKTRQRLFDSEYKNLQKASRVLVPSSHTKKLLVNEYLVDEKIITVANPGFDLSPVGRVAIEPPLIFSVGSLIHRKGHDVLLKALSKITHLPWQAVIAGSARDQEYFEELIDLRALLGLESRVEFVGEVDQQQLTEYYSKATLFALATRHEGYGMVFDEAMSYGLPIITCDSGAVLETVGEKAALVVEPDSDESFAEAISRVLENQETYQAMSKSALERTSTLNDWSMTASHFISAIESLSGQR